MGRRKDPLSRNQVTERAKRLADPEHGWRDRVLVTLATAILRAQGWVEATDAEIASPFPALPNDPGSKVRMVETPIDLSTEAGWAEAQEAIANLAPSPGGSLARAAESMAEQLLPRLVNELNSKFYKQVATWMGHMLKAGPQERFTVFSAHTPDVWAVPSAPLALPGGVFEQNDPAVLETIAENAACWYGARALYRSAVDARPDELGRYGLERPHLLRTLLVDLGVLEPDGERVGSLETLTGGAPVGRMATGMPVRVAAKALMRPDMWKSDDVGGLYQHQSDHRAGDGSNNKADYELRLIEQAATENLPDEALFFGMSQCQNILRTRGLDAAALHGVLCTYLAMLPDPTASIELDGRELLKDLGMPVGDGHSGHTTSDQLKRLGHTATVLMSLVFSSNGSQRDRSGWLTTAAGPLWNIGIRTDGYQQQMELDGVGENSSVKNAIIDGMTLDVRGGTWLKSHLNRGYKGGDGRYQFGPVALSVLRLGRYRQELAFRIGMHLSMGFRVWRSAWKDGSCTKKVGTILAEVLPDAEIQKATTHRQSGHELRGKWVAALATLQQCCGFRFEFDTEKYPVALIPECMRTPEQQEAAASMPKGATDKLLQSFITIHWPEDVQALRQGSALKAVEERPKIAPAARRSTLLPEPKKPNAATLTKVLAKAKDEGIFRNMREAAAMLQISQGQLSKLQNGHKELTDKELLRIEKMLGVRTHRRGDGYIRIV